MGNKRFQVVTGGSMEYKGLQGADKDLQGVKNGLPES